MSTTIFGATKDRYYMRQALDQAQKAAALAEVPIGAVVVDEHGAIIATGYNAVESRQCQTAHAEIIAIDHACKQYASWRLTGCWIYVTLEPCSMCMGLIRLSRLQGLVYGAASPLFGFTQHEGQESILYKNNRLIIISSVEQEQSAILLKDFFQRKRTT